MSFDIALWFGRFDTISCDDRTMIHLASRECKRVYIVILRGSDISRPIESRTADVKRELATGNVSIFNPGDVTMNWRDRAFAASQLRIRYYDNNHSKQIVEIMSLETYRFWAPDLSDTHLCESLRRTIVVYAEPASIVLPPSGTKYVTVRALTRKRARTTETQQDVVVVVLGGPCSGKTTLGHAIAERIGGKHASIGELYRIGCDERIIDWPVPGTPPGSAQWPWYQEIVYKVLAVLAELAKITGKGPFVIDGPTAEELKMCKTKSGVTFTHAVDLRCTEAVMLERMETRARPGETSEYSRLKRVREGKISHRAFSPFHFSINPL